MPSAAFILNPALDLDRLRAEYQRVGRVRIVGLLVGDGPQRLLTHLKARTDWRQILNSSDKAFELDQAIRDRMSDQQREALDTAVFNGARHGFQYRYETVRVADGVKARSEGADLLTNFASWLSGPGPLEVFKAITGASDTRFLDAQATAYARGDFLTAHDDDVAGKDRRAAYVFGLTQGWRPEWGGLLMFHGEQHKIEAVVPAFNTVDILAIPQPHSVSYVSPAAPSSRYSITGWLRAQPQPC